MRSCKFVKFKISLSGGHCDYSYRAPSKPGYVFAMVVAF